MKKLFTITVLLTFIFAGCAMQSEKPAVSTDEPKPTVSIENDAVVTVVPEEPTATVSPTDEPVPTVSVEAPAPMLEPTVAPTATPEPTPTTAPTPTATPTATPEPTVTPEPTATPAPTATPKPTSTPAQTATPKPTATPVLEKQVYTIETLPVTLYEPIYLEDGAISMYYCSGLTNERNQATETISNLLYAKYGTDGYIYEEPKTKLMDYDVIIDGTVHNIRLGTLRFIPNTPTNASGPSFVKGNETPRSNKTATAKKDVAIWDINGKVIGTLKTGEKVTIIADIFLASEHYLYDIIEYNGQKGYLDRMYLDEHDASGYPKYSYEWCRYWEGKTYAEYKTSTYYVRLHVLKANGEYEEFPDDYVFGEEYVVLPNGEKYKYPFSWK